MAPFRLATFNLESLDDRPGRGADFEQRLRVLRPQLQRLRADILCLQEVNAQRDARGDPRGDTEDEQEKPPRRFRALDRLLETTPYAGFARAATGHGPAGRESEAPEDIHNLVVLSRFPITGQAQLRNGLVPAVQAPAIAGITTAEEPGPLTWDRPLLHVTLRLEGGRLLHLINLHLRSPTGSYLPGQKSGPFSWTSIGGWATATFLSGIKRSGQALEARLLVERLLAADPDAWIAVCGDCNAVESEVPLRILIAADEDTGNGALAAGSLIPIERSIPADRRFSVIHHGRPQLLDHILVSRALYAAYRDIEIHNETLGDELVAYRSVIDPPESLHAPLVAGFESP